MYVQGSYFRVHITRSLQLFGWTRTCTLDWIHNTQTVWGVHSCPLACLARLVCRAQSRLRNVEIKSGWRRKWTGTRAKIDCRTSWNAHRQTALAEHILNRNSKIRHRYGTVRLIQSSKHRISQSRLCISVLDVERLMTHFYVVSRHVALGMVLKIWNNPAGARKGPGTVEILTKVLQSAQVKRKHCRDGLRRTLENPNTPNKKINVV